MTNQAVNADYYLLSEQLDDSERDIALRVRGFVDTEVLPIINKYWERAEFPMELLPKLAKLGIVGTTIDGYGCPGMSRLAAGMVAMEMSRGDGSVNTFLAVQSGLTMGSINLLGNEEQKQRWLPGLASLDKIGAFALTEPDHGSDSVALETSAHRDGDHYVLNGAKRWIGNGHLADVVVLWARDDSDGKVKAFIIETDSEGRHPEGYSAEVITGKIGKRAILQPDIRIENVRIPAENKLTHAESFRDAGKVLA
ncbi:MAG: acyl-CoA dehydrogenase family protein, partial [Mycetocola sp.]